MTILFGLFFLPLNVSAINSNQWQTEHFQIEHGLPDSTVYSIAQDKSGFIWFGTTNGLARFDGYSFISLKHDGANPATISNNNAGNIFIDGKNRLWIGTFGGGANQLNLNRGELTRYPYSSNQIETMLSENVQTFHEDSDGVIWIGTATGLYSLDGEQLTHIDPHHTDGDTDFSRIWDIEEDDVDGVLWLGTSDGLLKLNRKTNVFHRFRLPEEMKIDISSNQFRSLHFHNKILWIGSSSGLFSFNTELESFQFHAPDQKSIKVNDIYPSPDGGMLIASMEGLYLFNNLTNTFEQNQNGEYWQPMSHVDIRQIHIDQSGIMWLATRDSGVYKVDLTGGLFQHHTNYLPELQHNEKAKKIWALETDSTGNIILGTSDTLFKMNNNKVYDSIKTINSESIPGIIRDIEVDESNGQWIASSLGLYYLADGESIAELITTPFDLAGVEPADIFSIELTSEGKIWLALYNLGVLRWDPDNSQAVLMKEYNGKTFSDLNITHIFEDSRKNIWIGSNLIGAFRILPNLKQINHYKHEYNNSESISSNRIKDIFEDSEGRLWIANARGLNQYIYDQDSFIHYSQSDGLISGAINFVVEDSLKNLWLGSKFGLSRFNPVNKQVKKYLLNSAIRQDGLITRAVTIDHDDVIYLGSANGYYTFDPKDHQDSIDYQPPLTLTSVKIDNRPLQAINLEYQQDQFKLGFNDQLISFEFSVLDYKTPEQVQYLYRLKGLHDDWLDFSNTRRIDFKDLNPATYQLEVKAINNDGRWQEQMRQFEIVVMPVWWEQTWVQALFAIAVLMMAILLHYYRTYKIRKQNLHLENQVSHRTTELQKLNEQLELAANSDYLSGLPNRMAFINNYEERRKTSTPDSKNYCIVLADVDHFKKINDQYGHTAGDEILVELSAIMRKLIREGDLIARWGGEEFIFCIEGKDAQSTFALIDRIRKTIESSKIKYKDQIISVTMTFGICQRKPGMNLIECINAADDSMYQGKSLGRNRVIVSEGV